MRVALAAYRLMEEVARAHGGIDSEEAALLEAYRKAMGLARAELRAAEREDVAHLVLEGDDAEREATVLAMARVALADGRLSPKERDRILEVAGLLGIGRVGAANLVQRAEHEARHHRSVRADRRSLLWAGAAGVVLVGLLLARVGRGASAEESLRSQAMRHDQALVLLHVEYELVRGAERVRRAGDGSGFFVEDGGLIVTSKHVVQPWKFLADTVRLCDEGWSVDADSVRWTAWPSGARVLRDDQLERAAGWDSAAGTLELVATPPDRWVRGSRSLAAGGRYTGRFHALDNGDLAVLRARGQVPRGLPLAPPEVTPRPLDPVAVLGFPKGLELLEGELALSSPSQGVVRHVEDTILISADIFPGNSGGPCIDAAGRVIGVAARRAGEASLGRCIRVAHLRELLR